MIEEQLGSPMHAAKQSFLRLITAVSIHPWLKLFRDVTSCECIDLFGKLFTKARFW